MFSSASAVMALADVTSRTRRASTGAASGSTLSTVWPGSQERRWPRAHGQIGQKGEPQKEYWYTHRPLTH